MRLTGCLPYPDATLVCSILQRKRQWPRIATMMPVARYLAVGYRVYVPGPPRIPIADNVAWSRRTEKMLAAYRWVGGTIMLGGKQTHWFAPSHCK
jgi:hypothetical protein